jgi:hypothetical protein
VEPVFFKTLPNPEAEGGSENFAVEYIHHTRTPCKYELKVKKVKG